jgi:hypothetical protein
VIFETLTFLKFLFAAADAPDMASWDLYQSDSTEPNLHLHLPLHCAIRTTFLHSGQRGGLINARSLNQQTAPDPNTRLVAVSCAWLRLHHLHFTLWHCHRLHIGLTACHIWPCGLSASQYCNMIHLRGSLLSGLLSQFVYRLAECLWLD